MKRVKFALMGLVVICMMLSLGSAPAVAENKTEEALQGYPSNWGKWGPDDEIGTLNYLTPGVIKAAVGAIRSGKVFTLQRVWKGRANDPLWPGRTGLVRSNTSDYGSYQAGVAQYFDGMWGVDDYIGAFTHGTCHIDSLGHVSYGDQTYNGYDGKYTITRMRKVGILPLAQKGIVARGVFLDVARFKGYGPGQWMPPGTQITLQDLLDCAKAQNVSIRKNDWLIIRTGWLNAFDKDQKWFYANFNEPGITAEKELVEWWQNMEIIGWSTDTIGCEQTVSSVTKTLIPLHAALLRNLGSTMNEICCLEKLSEDCAQDGQYTGLYIASPLKIEGGCGSPVNSMFIK